MAFNLVGLGVRTLKDRQDKEAMTPFARLCFHLAALGSVAASLTHVWAMFAGPEAYASLGAPPDVIASAEAGTWYAPTVTTGIATVLLGWALYAWSAVGFLPRMPLLRTGLIAIATVLVLRGFALVPALILVPEHLGAFDYWSAGICLTLGLVFGVGIWRGWAMLGKVRSMQSSG